MRRRRRGLATEPLPVPAGPGLLVVWYDHADEALAADVVDLRAHLVALGREDVAVAAVARSRGLEALDEGAMLVAGWRRVRPPRQD